MVSEKEIVNALSTVIDPELRRDVVSLGMVKEIKIKDGEVTLTLNLTTPACPLRERLQSETLRAVSSIKGVKEVKLNVTASTFATRNYNDEFLKGVKNIIAVASGKGGVGKTTVAVNLACSLASSGANVGILDADVYGPNVPKMLGINENLRAEGNVLLPAIAHSLKVMSLGLVYKDETPLIWRGPLVAGAVKQMLNQVRWGDLDYLVVDLPPGTGDAPLTLAQTVPIGGVVIVTTPQEAALSIAAKSLAMFRRLGIPIVGIIENMSYFVCPNCHEKLYPFSTGGGRQMAARLNENFLGEIPLSNSIREASDSGKPVVISSPDSPETQAYKEIAFRVAGILSMIAFSKMNNGAG